MASNILLSDMPADILNCIQDHLPLVDYLRFPAVCRSFRSAAKQISHLPFSDTHFPWLLSYGSFYSNGFTATAMIPVSPHPKTYSIPFPPFFKDFNILSSDRHSLFVEYQHYKGPPSSEGIYILNPFDSWAQLGRLPSASSARDIGRIFNLVVNNTNTVVLGITCRGLAYTRLSNDDTDRRRWISLNDTLPPPTDMFQDVVAYKDDLFYAVQMNATNVLALDFSSSPTTPVRVTDMTLNLQLCTETPGWSSFQNSCLISSPSGLFLVRWRCLLKTGEHHMKRREIDIYRLMDDEYAPKKWVQINSLDNFCLFLSHYSSISLSPIDFPRLRSNCIYLPQDAIWNIRHDYDNSESYDDNYDDNNRHLIYDLGNGTWEQFCRNEYFAGIWVTPRLRPNSLLLG